MLGMQDANPNDVTRERFEMLMEELVLQKESFSLQDGGCVFTIPQKDGSERFVMLRITGEDEVQVGLVEDVTATTLERRRIEHERDYDVLTDLYNRRAFDARAKKLFRMPEKLGHAALLMMDMDTSSRSTTRSAMTGATDISIWRASALHRRCPRIPFAPVCREMNSLCCSMATTDGTKSVRC